ncbi:MULTISPECIES: helix-turn-helix domain-containing protein [Paenibacillus]|uniref:Helix-turn-helix domain-containing protein n=1 Tax=Paenibacillus campinasensis TaxID=66347 RepID=A0A268EWT9_9BACL|nr:MULTISPECIES: helix-turn-helix transcriptional regulator [Paenibacillus]MUG68312.1 helix-turn-helix domain-containing protein [Paenibacillus campinasensis]PAD77590.1 transcriptional regulator [Paenibacillus campinasensis]PAK49731.1 transcriptional regulator [Paenibacillus sp. 7541]
MQSIYQRIEHLIEDRGMTKKAFCEALGISTGNFGDWKRGKTTPSTNKLIEIAAFFSVSLDWLIIGRGSPFPEIKETREGYGMEHGAEQEIMIDPAELSELGEQEREFIREYLEFSAYRKDKGRNKDINR